METKIEYQVSPELAEAIAIEQFEILFPKRLLKLRYLPVTSGFLFAFIAALIPGFISIVLNFFRSPYSSRYLQVGGYAFTDGYLMLPVAFVFGFAVGFAFNLFLRMVIVAMARSAYEKIGPTRTVSWNSESIAFQSPGCEIKVNWQMIDKIEIGSLGVYGVSGRRALFAIPEHAFAPNATIAELTQAWRGRRMQPQ